MSQLLTFIESRLESPAPLGSALQVSFYQTLVRTKNWKMLGRMAARTDLSAEATALVRTHREIDVVAGWAANPARTNAEIADLLLGERRATVLAAVAARTDLDEQAYRRISSIKGRILLEPLAWNPSVPRSIRAEKLAALLDHSDVRGEKVLALLESDRSLLVEAAALAASPVSMSAFLECGVVGDDLAGEYCDRLLLDGDAVVKRCAYVDHVLLSLVGFRLSAPRKKKLIGALRRRAKSYGNRSYQYTRFRDAAKSAALFDDRLHDSIELLREASDGAAASAAFRQLVGAYAGSPEVIDRVLEIGVNHRFLPAEDMLEHFSDIGYSDEDKLIAEWARRNDYVAIAKAAVGSYGLPGWFSASRVTAESLPAVLDAIATLPRSSGDGLPDWVAHEMLQLGWTDRLVESAPWWQLSFLMQEYPGLAVAVEDALNRRLADQPQFWEVFETLASEFEGSFPDLLDMCARL